MTEQKHYRTKGRSLLLEYLAERTTEVPMSAEDIYRELSEKEGAPGQSSVYRMLSEMTAEGLLRKYEAGENDDRFVYQYVEDAKECEHHFHLRCTVCGKVEHLTCDCGKSLCENLLKSHGFVVDSGKSVLYGVCADCARRNS